MIFIDTKPTWRSLLLLLVTTATVYLLGLGISEIRFSDEALLGAFAQDFAAGNSFFKTLIYGHRVPGFPLYSWCIVLCSLFRQPNPFTLRLPAVLSLFALAISSGIMARKVQSSYAGLIATAVTLTSVLSFRTALTAHNDMVVSALLSIAWYITYLQGWKAHRWWLAWGLALLLVLLASFGTGVKAIIIFYAPYFFMGHRLRSVDFLQSRPHLFFCFLLTLCLSLWIYYIPEQPFMPWNALSVVRSPESLGSYCRHLVSMLPKILCYLFPWTFLAWAPFCLALRQFEHETYACRFLRAIVVTNAVIFWLMPGGSPLHLLPVFGPMAVLIGVYSEIVIRRYKDFFGWLLTISNRLCFLIACLLCLFWAATFVNVVHFDDFSQTNSIFCLLCALSTAVTTGFLLFNPKKASSFRTMLLLSIFGWAILDVSTISVIRHCHNMNREISGMTLACHADDIPMLASNAFGYLRPAPLKETMEKEDISKIYLVLSNGKQRNATLVETFYMQAPIRQISDLATELPDQERVVFLLSPFLPADTKREWTSLSKHAPLGTRRNVSLAIQGTRPLLDFHAEMLPPQKTYQGLPELKLYRGELKK